MNPGNTNFTLSKFFTWLNSTIISASEKSYCVLLNTDTHLTQFGGIGISNGRLVPRNPCDASTYEYKLAPVFLNPRLELVSAASISIENTRDFPRGG